MQSISTHFCYLVRLHTCMVRLHSSLSVNRRSTVVRATFKYDEPRLKMSHEGCDIFSLGSSDLNVALSTVHEGCSGVGTRGDGVPTFFRQGGRVPHSPRFLD